MYSVLGILPSFKWFICIYRKSQSRLVEDVSFHQGRQCDRADWYLDSDAGTQGRQDYRLSITNGITMRQVQLLASFPYRLLRPSRWDSNISLGVVDGVGGVTLSTALASVVVQVVTDFVYSVLFFVSFGLIVVS